MTETLQIAEPATLAEHIRAAPAALPQVIAQLSNAEAAALVDHLKSEADRHWWINANQSVEFADLIVAIGRARGDAWQVALGTMARGDALKFVGSNEEAWRLLGQAGELFESIGDEVGWARTRIGRLMICIDLNHVAEALDDAERAREIFQHWGEYERLFGLCNNLAMAHSQLGDQQRALTLYQAAQSVVPQLARNRQQHISLLATNIGFCHHMLGEFTTATQYYAQARQIFEARRELRGIALIDHNLAHIAMSQGQYRTALSLLHQARERYLGERLSLDATNVKRDIVEIYLLLNRYTEARDLARQVIANYRTSESAYREGLTLIHLATAEANLSQAQIAAGALAQAETLFAGIGASIWQGIAQLRRGQLALRAGDTATALQIATSSIKIFEQHPIEYGTANLLYGQSLLAAGTPGDAAGYARSALAIGKSCNIPTLRYGAHLLIGAVAEACGRPQQAIRRYSAAAATIDQMQRRLTITLRSQFLDTKGQALAGLMRLYLQSGRVECAFNALERSKSQHILGYLSNREQLRWRNTDARSHALIEELNQLRAEHRWFYHLAYEQAVRDDGRPAALTAEQARVEVAQRELRMRQITEQLYLQSGDEHMGHVAAPRIGDVQRWLADDTALIEFYNDGHSLWAFTLDQHQLEICHLPTPASTIDQLSDQLQSNIEFALKAGPGPISRNLTRVAQRILQQLYQALLAPLASRLAARQRIVVVPYGALHYLPFHLLHDGQGYLLEQHEVAVLPAAGLATRPPVRGAPGARVLCHSWDGRLSQTLAEARAVERLFGGEVYTEGAAGRACLNARPTQILHIAAHGQHRLDQPDLSYIELADGQLYTDDLLQHDLSYELVTLSACETGRAHVAAGDELIGLGRGFLYAGAGALITSLWQIPDALTTDFMQRLYTSLRAGASKTAALRAAQRAICADAPGLHPAFWGAFQLVGNPHPLSSDPL